MKGKSDQASKVSKYYAANVAPDEYKQINSLKHFKSNITSWICANCPSRLCKRFVPNLDFLWDVHLSTVSFGYKINGLVL